METKEIIQEIEEKGLYDFIANNYWKLSKEDLKNLLIEYDFNTYENLRANNKKELYEEIKKDMLTSFEDRNN